MYSMGDCVLCHEETCTERAQIQNNKHTTLKSMCLLFCNHALFAQLSTSITIHLSKESTIMTLQNSDLSKLLILYKEEKKGKFYIL